MKIFVLTAFVFAVVAFYKVYSLEAKLKKRGLLDEPKNED